MEAKETDTTTVDPAEIEPATLEKVENELATLVTDFQITEKRRDTIKVLIWTLTTNPQIRTYIS